MKRLFAAALALYAASTFAATLNPVSLLNPVGSTAGQGIVSTGPTTAPVWGSVSISTLTGILPIANGGTGQTTAAAALTALGGLSTTTAASTYLTQTNAATTYGAKASPLSQFAATTSAQLAGVLTDETGTGAAVFGTSPTITTPNIVGVTSGANAAAGSVGDTGVVSNLTGVSMTSTVGTNCASAILPAGDWDVSGVIRFVPAATSTVASIQAGITSTSATLAGVGTQSTFQGSLLTGVFQELSTPTVRKLLTTSTTVYLAGIANFGVSTLTCSGVIYPRLRR